ncbi:pre-mRNA-splicing factor CWC22 homolog isoform X2 [Metopolophium dirhodum]|uniref:pre-mRNA-splicing factor CWC22 homolog isoform X2 n=1 Tax=Metopolophium dirhodum TaxID=44670 RepID=UPI00299054A3|nr:pre-mRNA-splicing factor CWC22 homolog isoform X2 [Metopolophium dirhodum]
MNKPLPPPPQYPSHLINYKMRRRSVTYRYCPSAGPKKGVSQLKAIPEYTVNKQSEEYQTTSWNILETSISNLIKHVNSEAKAIEIKKKIVRLNIWRGKGILCKNIMEAQLNSTRDTRIYAFFISLIYDVVPSVGELLLARCVFQFCDANKKKEKCKYLASVLFISYLINYDVVSPLMAIRLLHYIIKQPTQDSIDAFFVILNTCGHKLREHCMAELNAILDSIQDKALYNIRFFRKIKHMIHIILKTISLKNSKLPDLFRVPLNISFNQPLTSDQYLDSYFYDPDYEASEQIYSLFRKQILGTDIKHEYILMYDYNTYGAGKKSRQKLVVKRTGNPKIDKKSKILKNVVKALMNSTSFKYEKCASLLMKIKLKPGQEKDICCVFLELCCENDDYTENLGHITQLNRLLIDQFEKLFVDTYAIVNSLDKIKLQNVAKYFAQLLYTDTISWMVLSTIHLNEKQTTVSTGNFVKHLFHELVKHIGEHNMNYYITDPSLKDAFEGIFGNNQNHSSFSVNLFSPIGLDGLIRTFQDSLIF